MLAEVKGVIAAKQGLSCSAYFRLSVRTAHLRERLYVAVRDGENLFLPNARHEHFPVAEIEEYYLERVRFGYDQSIGAAGGEVVFICEGRKPEDAEEGATVIERELVGLDPVLNQSLFSRWAAAMPEKISYLTAARNASLPPAYRPERMPERAGVPEALSEAEKRGRKARPVTLGEALGWSRPGRPQAPQKTYWEEDFWKH